MHLLLPKITEAEGTRELVGSSGETHRCALSIRAGGQYGVSAAYDGPIDERVNIYIANPEDEIIYMGFSKLSSKPVEFQIKDPNGNVVYTNEINNANITEQNFEKFKIGPNTIYSGGYDPSNFTFDLSNQGLPAGNYNIEFRDKNNPNGRIKIWYWDITVANASTNADLKGRVWSKRWSLHQQNTHAKYSFEGAFYAYATNYDDADEGFVTKLDFADSGFRPWAFVMAYNRTGPGTSGDLAEDLKSVLKRGSVNPEFPVFLNNPDETIWPSGEFGDFATAPEIKRCGAHDFYFNLSATKPGTYQILLNLDPKTWDYDEGTSDRYFIFDIVPEPGEEAPYEREYYWDGKDGFGDYVEVDEELNILFAYSDGVLHFPIYDAEYNANGFAVEQIRPTSTYPLLLLWDDSNLTDGNTFPIKGDPSSVDQKVELTGVFPPGHVWDNYTNNNDVGYGNKNTINTFWYTYRVAHPQFNYEVSDFVALEAGAPKDLCGLPYEVVLSDADSTTVSPGRFSPVIGWTSSGNGTFSADDALNPTYYASPDDIASGQVTLRVQVDMCSDVYDEVVIRFFDPVSTALSVSDPALCPGGTADIEMSNSEEGVNYQLYKVSDNSSVGAMQVGTGGILTFSVSPSEATDYKVGGSHANSTCVASMIDLGVVTIGNLPDLTLAISSPEICVGENASITLTGSQNGVSYQLRLNDDDSDVGTAVAGNDGDISFSVSPSSNTIYNVFATNSTSGCGDELTNLSTVSVHSSPDNSFTVSDEDICLGNTATVTVSDSEDGFSYVLKDNGGTTVAGPIIGVAGNTINFELTPASSGQFTVFVTNSYNCSVELVDKADINILSAPDDSYAVGDASACLGDALSVTVANSQTQVNYYLQNSQNVNVSGPISGTDNQAIEFTFEPTADGNYHVFAENSQTNCSVVLTDVAVVSINDKPNDTYAVSDPSVCSGGQVTIQVDGSESGISYILRDPSDATVTEAGTATGDGNAFSFTFTPTESGTYNVYAEGSSAACSQELIDKANVVVNSAPSLSLSVNGDEVCENDGVATVVISPSEAGVNYTLKNSTDDVVGGPVAGTEGSSINLSLNTPVAGVYTVTATNPTTGCYGELTNTATITVNDEPTSTLSVSDAEICLGEEATITVTGSENTILYQLIHIEAVVGESTGNGGAISFTVSPSETTEYYVLAKNTVTSCSTSLDDRPVVTVNSLPNSSFTVGDPEVCAGESVTVSVSGSESGVDYIIRDASNVQVATTSAVAGTGSEIGFTFTPVASGTYNILATNSTTGCSARFDDLAVVSVNPTPAINLAVADEDVCLGSEAEIVVSGSITGVSYQLRNDLDDSNIGSALSGNGTTLTFTVSPAVNTTYNIYATSSGNSCGAELTNMATVNVLSVPNIALAIDDPTICSGANATITLTGSESGVTYQLRENSDNVNVGGSVAGDGSAINFSLTPLSSGTYNVLATNDVTNCSLQITDLSQVTVNALPSDVITVSDPSVCNGGNATIELDNSENGVDYVLKDAVNATVGTESGTGSAIDFTVSPTITSNYTIVATNSTTTCSTTLSDGATVTVYSQPSSALTVSDPTVCYGSDATVSVSGSEAGFSYIVRDASNNTVAGPLTGDGSTLDFTVSATSTTTYNVLAYTSNCEIQQADDAVITVNALPSNSLDVSDDIICNGATANIVVSNTVSGISYQLHLDSDDSNVGSSQDGNGGDLTFTYTPNTTTNYHILATNSTSGCSVELADKPSVTVNSLPSNTLSVSDDAICNGATASVVVSGTAANVTYTLRLNADDSDVATQSSVGGNITFNVTPTSTTVYNVLAHDNTTLCSNELTDLSTVTVNALPATNLTVNEAEVCEGTTAGIVVNGSVSGVNYQLRLNSDDSNVGSAVAGNNGNITFNVTPATTTVYNVLATNGTGCKAELTDLSTVTINALPTASLSVSDDAICNGAAATITVYGSQTGVTYQLRLESDDSNVGASVAGDGGNIEFTPSPTSLTTYNVYATNSSSSCGAELADKPTVTVTNLPEEKSVTDDAICIGSTATIEVASSESGVNYQLRKTDDTPVSQYIAGTGGTISFEVAPSSATTYNVYAENATAGCSKNLADQADVTINPIPITSVITGTASTGCNSSSIGYSVTNTTGSTYAWTVPSDATIATGAGTSAITVNFGENGGFISVIETNTNGCVGNVVNFGVDVTGCGIVADFQGDDLGVCVGEPVVFQDLSILTTGATLYEWSFGDGSSPSSATVTGNSGGAPHTITYYTAGSKTVELTVTEGATDTETKANYITVYSYPSSSLSVTGDDICPDETGTITVLSSVSGVSYQLRLESDDTNVGVAVVSTGGNITFAVEPSSTTTYNVLATKDDCGVELNDKPVVVVNSLPTNSYTVGDPEVCDGSQAIVVVSNSQNNVQYSLIDATDAVVAGPTGGVDSQSMLLSFTPTVSGTFRVLANNISTGCQSYMTDVSEVTVNSLPTTVLTVTDPAVCNGDAATIVVRNSIAGVTYALRTDANDVIVSSVSSTGGDITFDVSPTVSTDYNVFATNNTTTCSAELSDKANVTINALPNSGLVVNSLPTAICIGSNSEITVFSSTIGVTYSLLLDSDNSVIASTLGTNSNLSWDVSPTATTGYKVRAVNNTTQCVSMLDDEVTITVNSLPTTDLTVSDPVACDGNVATISVSGTQNGVSYQLRDGGNASVGNAVMGNGGDIFFTVNTSTTAVYNVLATRESTACAAPLSDLANVTINSLPTNTLTVSGDVICNGGTGAVTILGTQSGVTYDLRVDATNDVLSSISSTGGNVSYNVTPLSTTVYNILATNNSTGCVVELANQATVTVNDLPNRTLIVDDPTICNGSGGSITVFSSENSVDYKLYKNSDNSLIATISGTGNDINFTVSPTVSTTYYVKAIDDNTSCDVQLSDKAMVTVNSLPSNSLSVSEDVICVGDYATVVVSNTQLGLTYQLRLETDNTIVNSSSSTGGNVSFSINPVSTTEYNVFAVNNATGCSTELTDKTEVTVNVLPNNSLSVSDDVICVGVTGEVVVSNSQSGVVYQLRRSADNSMVSSLNGNGGSLTFSDAPSTSTSYNVLATNSTTGCSTQLVNSTTITVNPLPNKYLSVTDPAICAGENVTVTIGNTATGIEYILRNSSDVQVVGTTTQNGSNGNPVSFTFMAFASGVYNVLATNSITGCNAELLDKSNVTINALPIGSYAVSDPEICYGETATVTVANSQTGVNYVIVNDLDNQVTGTGVVNGVNGNAISFTFIPDASATFTIIATNSISGCETVMTDVANVVVNALPNIDLLVSDPIACLGAAVIVTVSNTQTGINYTIRDASDTQVIGTGVQAGNDGNSVGFNFTPATTGTYSILAANAITGCNVTLDDNAVVSVNALPNNNYDVTDPTICLGEEATIFVVNSQSNVSYTLRDASDNTVAGPISGISGNAVRFTISPTADGVYNVLASNVANCSAELTNKADVTVNALPFDNLVVSDDEICYGDVASFVVGNSQSGVEYSLKNNLSQIIAGPIAGNNTDIEFSISSLVTQTYSVYATNLTTGCNNTLVDLADVVVNALPNGSLTLSDPVVCAGEDADIILSNSESGISYQLRLDADDSEVETQTGDGNNLTFTVNLSTTVVYNMLALNSATGCQVQLSDKSIVTVRPLPNIDLEVTDPVICLNDNAEISVRNTQSGFTYQLRDNSNDNLVGTTVSTGGVIQFTISPTTTTDYNVLAINNSTLCSAQMTDLASVTVNDLPTADLTVTGDEICYGEIASVVISNTQTGVDYLLRKDNDNSVAANTIAGTGTDLTFEFSPIATTNYNVLATNTITGCYAELDNLVSVTVNALPNAALTVTDPEFCEGDGGDIAVNNSQSGVTYQLQLNDDDTPVGTAVAGTGGTITYTVNPTKTTVYNVVATNDVTNCISEMDDLAIVTVNVRPNVELEVTDLIICDTESGLIAVEASQEGVTYQLRLNSDNTIVSTVVSTGGDLTFEVLPTETTVYNVNAFYANSGCENQLNDITTVTVNDLPSASIVVSDPTICNGNEATVLLSATEDGITYEVYEDGAQFPFEVISSVGADLTFGVSPTESIVYTLIAINNSTFCQVDLLDQASITVNPLPNVALTVDDPVICAGETAVITLTGSENDISYQLRDNTDDTNVGTAVSGTGNDITFNVTPDETITYNVLAINGITLCQAQQSDLADVTVNDLPELYTFSGEDTYCDNTSGVTLSLASSQSGINYQIYKNGTSFGPAMVGTGDPLNWTNTTFGTYTVVATNIATECTNSMLETVVVTEQAAPELFTVGGSGAYCIGTTGLSVILSSSETGIFYQLYNGTNTVGVAVDGTGSELSWDDMSAGAYTVVASNGTGFCELQMSGSAAVVENPSPSAFDMSGDVEYCQEAMLGATVELSGSESNVNYQLYRNGSAPVGLPVTGDGSAISWTEMPQGTYTVSAINTATSCINDMTGATVVTENPLPSPFAVQGSGEYCQGEDGLTISLSGSETGVDYQLFDEEGATVGTSVSGTGSAISWTNVIDGTYNVVAVNNISNCENEMAGQVTIVVNPTPNTTMTLTGDTITVGNDAEIILDNSTQQVLYSLYFYETNDPVNVARTGDGQNISFFVTPGPEMTTEYYIVAQDMTTFCSATFEPVIVIVNHPPDTENDTLTVQANSTGNYISLSDNDSDIDGDLDESTVDVIYSSAGGTVTYDGNGGIEYTPRISFMGVDTLVYRICDETDLCTIDTVYIRVQSRLIVPNAFSPNGDDLNDKFVILGLEDYPINEIYIFNRWGNQVYYSAPYKNDWDGKAQNSVKAGDDILPDGVYFFILKLGNGTEPIKGNIYLKH